MRRSIAAICIAFALLSGCNPNTRRGGGGSGRGAGYPPSGGGAAGPCWPLAPLTLEVLEHGREFEPVSFVRGDGVLLHGKGGSIGALHGDVLVGAKGNVSCRGRRIVLEGQNQRNGAFYGQRDELVIPGELSIFVGDDGTVFMTMGGRNVFGPAGSGAQGSARVVGPVTAARRTAELLVLLSLGGPPG